MSLKTKTFCEFISSSLKNCSRKKRENQENCLTCKYAKQTFQKDIMEFANIEENSLEEKKTCR